MAGDAVDEDLGVRQHVVYLPLVLDEMEEVSERHAQRDRQFCMEYGPGEGLMMNRLDFLSMSQERGALSRLRLLLPLFFAIQVLLSLYLSLPELVVED